MCGNEREAGGSVKLQGLKVVKVCELNTRDQWTVHKRGEEGSTSRVKWEMSVMSDCDRYKGLWITSRTILLNLLDVQCTFYSFLIFKFQSLYKDRDLSLTILSL